jgi:hypothetical protein
MKRQETLRRRAGKNTTIAGVILSLACGGASQAQIAAVQAHRDALRQGITPDEQKIHAQGDAELARVEGRPDPSRSQLAVCSPGIGRPLIPPFAGPPLRRDHVDVFVRLERVDVPRLLDVAVQRIGLVLRQHMDLAQAGVQTV